MATDPDPSITGVFGKERARQIRWALWFRRQFTATSLTCMGAIAAAAWAYIGHLHEQLSNVTTRVVVLETEVVPDAKLKEKVATLERDDAVHDAQIKVLQDDYRTAQEHAGDDPTKGRAKR